jgi:hypothetical protein
VLNLVPYYPQQQQQETRYISRHQSHPHPAAPTTTAAAAAALTTRKRVNLHFWSLGMCRDESCKQALKYTFLYKYTKIHVNIKILKDKEIY